MNQQLYTTSELAAMSAEELRVAQANGFVKPGTEPQYTTELPDTAKAASSNPYAPTTWGSNEYDFTVPSGQKCRMKKLRPEELVENGLLDKLTRLPGFAQDEIDKATGKPPVPAMPSKEQMTQVIEAVNELVPMVVVQPYIRAIPTEGEPREEGVIYVDDIDLFDRIAIMNRATQGVSKLDAFREES